MAAVAEVGNPSVSKGTRIPAAAALLAASGPATPSIAPRPNSSRLLERFLSRAYESMVGSSEPPPGMAPMGKPMKVPRGHHLHDRPDASRVIKAFPVMGMISSW